MLCDLSMNIGNSFFYLIAVIKVAVLYKWLEIEQRVVNEIICLILYRSLFFAKKKLLSEMSYVRIPLQ